MRRILQGRTGRGARLEETGTGSERRNGSAGKRGNGMNKGDLVRHVASETGMDRSAAGAAVNAVLSGITGALARGEPASLPGFGTFAARHRPARTARNPHRARRQMLAGLWNRCCHRRARLLERT